MTKWGHLPNAVHIDQVFSVMAGRSNTAREIPPGWAASWNDALHDVKDLSRDSAMLAAMDSVWGTTHCVALAGGAILALIAYDHADEYITMTPSQAQVWGELSGDPVYVLLRPYLKVRAQIEQTQ
jgi:hypothetical protein